MSEFVMSTFLLGVLAGSIGTFVTGLIIQDIQSRKPLSDEEFMDIALQEMEGEKFRKALADDDEYA